MNKQLATLFKPTDIIGFKQQLTSYTTYQYDHTTMFICLNPLKQPGPTSLDNIAEYRNILIEMDTGTIEEQWKLIESSKLPWTTCVYSGGKSLHFIISLTTAIDSHFAYTKLVKEITNALGADTSSSNPNRLTRLAGSVRDNGVEQELIEVRKQVKETDLYAWRFVKADARLRSKMDKIGDKITGDWLKREIAVSSTDSVKSTDTFPPVFRQMLDGGVMHPETNSRHESLVKFGVWLKDNWHKEEEIPLLLQQASDMMGIGNRGDVEGVLKWLQI